MSLKPQGLWVALATPFKNSGDIDLDGFRTLVRHVVKGGADGLIPLGSTGEAATLEEAERDQVITACLEEADGKPVVVGTGHNATKKTVAWTQRAQQLGAQGALMVTPYYNKPTPSGLLAHYSAVVNGTPDFPIIVYNVPGRTGLNLLPSTLSQLWKLPGIVAVKESSGNLGQIGAVAQSLPHDKSLLSGDDNLALASIAVGACGLVSVLGNLVPRQTKALVEAARGGRVDEAQRLQKLLLPLMDALFVETSPIPLKAGLEFLSISGSAMRLPLTSAQPLTREAIESTLTTVMESA
jgi:4-hydroxy-tetrahydrodipicolinate synthase